MRASSSSFAATHLRLTRRLLTRQFSKTSTNADPVSSSGIGTIGTNPKGERFQLGSLAKWVAGIAVGSGIGYASWTYADEIYSPVKKSVSSFVDWATTAYADDDDDDDNPKFLFGDGFRRRVFFNYEKRIRLRSPPEKVFEYFASIKNPDGEVLMTPADLMRAVVPVFPPSESNLVREGYLRGERSPGELRCEPSGFFMLFDVNNDGLISFKEYIFFVTLLGIPESSFSVAFKMFDLDHNGAIDKEEFKRVMALMRAHNRQGAHHNDGLRTGLRVDGTVEDGGLVEYFFEENGNELLHHDTFVKFLRDLREEMLNLEFAHYDYKKRGTISAKDFALSMIAAADMSHLGKLLSRIETLNKEHGFNDMRITLKEFKQFAELRRRLLPFSMALFTLGETGGLLTKKDFQRAASHVCGVELTDNVIEIIFQIFDANQDGNLSSNEFIRVLEKRERDIAKPIESGMLAAARSVIQALTSLNHDLRPVKIMSKPCFAST